MRDNNRLLLAFNDQEELNTLSGYLRETGFDITAVTDGASALEQAIVRPPSLIISDLDLPVVSGERLFGILRANPHTARIPFLLVSDAVADIKGFRTGRDIYLARPINLVEMYGRLRQTLSISDALSAGTKEIEGRLSHMSLPDILQFLFLNRKEGELRISSSRKSGSVYIKDGEIYNAYAGGVDREKALYRLLLWTEGKFEFVPMPVTVSKKIRLSVTNLLMEGMRQADEFRKSMDSFPGKKSILRHNPAAAPLAKGLSPVVYDVVQLSEAYPRVEDLVEHCSQPDFIVYKAIAALLAKKVLIEEGASLAGADGPESILPREKMITLREKIISRFSNIFNLNYGKVLLVSTSGAPAADFINRCATVPGYTSRRKSALFQFSIQSPIGTAGSIELYGGMELLLFSIPEATHMGPLWRAFGSNAVGLVLLWDEEGEGGLEVLEAAKQDILSRTGVPVAYVYSGAGPPDMKRAREAFALNEDEAPFVITPDGAGALEVFTSIFNKLLNEDQRPVAGMKVPGEVR